MMNINEMFFKKNYEILKNKLDLDINNNADSLNHTISNFIDLKAIGLNKYITELYDDLKIKYKDEKVKKIIEEESKILKSIFLKNIEERKENISKFFNQEIDATKIEDTYLNDYHNHIDNLTETFKENVDVSAREEICTKFSEKVIGAYKLPDQYSKEKLLEYINKSYCNGLIEKMVSESILRNSTLKNLSKEAFERFKSMNEKTTS
ncbi:MAG: hypothetical protein IJN90_02405 [Bacilli bacterium]|nr:hypothetical protein [Bacilli bacterium]